MACSELQSSEDGQGYLQKAELNIVAGGGLWGVWQLLIIQTL